MPFVCTLMDGARPRVQHLSQGADRLSIAPIGYDSQTGQDFAVVVALSPEAGGRLEHTFCVTRSALDDNDTPDHFFSGRDTRRIIVNQRDRHIVLDLICHVTAELVNEVRPECLVHATYDAYDTLDRVGGQGPLAKHTLVIRTIEATGYEIRQVDPYHGRFIWYARRVD